MKGGLAAMVYGAKLLRDTGITLHGDVVVACVVQEEPCEGLGSRVLIEEEQICPNWVVLGEPTGLEVSRGQQKLFDDSRCFFYITNDGEALPEEIVFSANDRCNQENLLQQLKSGVRSLSAPVDNLLSNWAYMVMASLAWSLKAWSALLLPESGRRREKRQEEKHALLRMDFGTFRRVLMQVPTQVLRTSRKIVCRLLAWNPWQDVFFRLLEQIARPLRC